MPDKVSVAHLLPIQPSANAAGKATKDGPTPWAPATRVSELLPGYWLQHGPDMTVEAIWRVNLWKCFYHFTTEHFGNYWGDWCGGVADKPNSWDAGLPNGMIMSPILHLYSNTLPVRLRMSLYPCGRLKVGSWLLNLAWLIHLGIRPADGRSLCLSITLPFNYITKL